jgi:hypothetical protein
MKQPGEKSTAHNDQAFGKLIKKGGKPALYNDLMLFI